VSRPSAVPPRWLRRLAALVVRGPDAPYVLGDLDEAYARERSRGSSRSRSARRYLRNTLVSALSLVRARLRLPQLAPSLLDLKLGIRMLRKQPALTAVAVFALSMGIPVGLVPYHIAQVTSAPLPFEEGDRIVKLIVVDRETSRVRSQVLRDMQVWREELTSVRTLAASSAQERNIAAEDGRAAPVRGSAMTASGFDVARVAPLMGRRLVAADEQPGAPDVVVVSHDLWQSRLGGDPDVVGRTIRIGSVPHEVVGVMPQGFLFPYHDYFWVPLRADPLEHGWGEGPSIGVFGRLADGVTRAEANTELNGIGRRIAEEHPDTHRLLQAEVVSYSGIEIYADPTFWMLQLLALLLLTVACGNVGTLVLARTAMRRGEIAVRTALGASRARVVTQLFFETLMLGLLGAGFGLLIGDAAARRLEAVVQTWGMPFWFDLGITWKTATIALLLAGFSATVAGVGPALKATGKGIGDTLRRASAGMSGIRFGGVSTVLIVAEVALATAFLVMGGLVAPTVFQDPDEGMGIDPDPYLAATFELPGAGRGPGAGAADTVGFGARLRNVQTELVARLHDDTSVQGVAVASRLPGDGHGRARIEVEGSGEGIQRAYAASVAVDYFRALEQRILIGRDFDRSDVATPPDRRTSVIVNEAFVREVLGGDGPVGRRFRLAAVSDDADPGPWLEIVGVVGHLGMNETNPERDEGFYVPASLGEINPVRLAVRVASDPASYAPDLRTLARRVDADALIRDPLSLRDNARRSEMRVGTFWGGLLLAMIAGVAVVLSAAGLYALVSFTVSERRREIGIRTALGARTSSIVMTIARRATLQLVTGIVAGVVLWWILDRNVIGLSGDTSLHASDLVGLFGACAGGTLLVGLSACLPPMLRALRIRPVEVLKEV